MQIERAIVTAGSGFIGSHLVDVLIERGVDVTVIDKVEPKVQIKNAKASYIIRDIRHEGLDEVFANLKPTVVFHLAAHIDDRESVVQPVMNADHNVMGSLRVFEAARRATAGDSSSESGDRRRYSLRGRHLAIVVTFRQLDCVCEQGRLFQSAA